MKKFIALVLIIVMAASACVYALTFDEEETQKMAVELEEQELLSGVGKNEDGTTNFALRRAMTRQEAMVMLVKLLGKLDEANEGVWENDFTDVDDWAKPFVGYAYANGYTSGANKEGTRFGAHNPVTANQYLTFVLKAMGYDANTDFNWQTAWLFTDNLGITAGEYNEETNAEFLRGDAIKCTYGILQLCQEEAESCLVGATLETTENPDNPEENEMSEDYEGLDGITEIARQYLGVPYVSAGKTPAGFDCSGFVIYVMKEYGFRFTAGSCQDLYDMTNYVDPSDRKVGDIVYFKGTYSTDRMSHVGIYIGNNQMIHASTSYHGCICIVDLGERYWEQHFDSYGRMPQGYL